MIGRLTCPARPRFAKVRSERGGSWSQQADGDFSRKASCRIGFADRQVLVGIVELGQETVFEDVHFVNVILVGQANTVVRLVADFKGQVRRKFTLKSGVPGFHHRRTQIRIENVQRGSRCGIQVKF